MGVPPDGGDSPKLAEKSVDKRIPPAYKLSGQQLPVGSIEDLKGVGGVSLKPACNRLLRNKDQHRKSMDLEPSAEVGRIFDKRQVYKKIGREAHSFSVTIPLLHESSSREAAD